MSAPDILEVGRNLMSPARPDLQRSPRFQLKFGECSMTTTKQETNRLKQLTKQGQSIWLDFIRRSYVRNGDLRKLVDEDGLRGVTSNPSIFERPSAAAMIIKIRFSN